jgi:hypothetical protein
MERAGTRPSMHRLIGDAVMRAARLQEESRTAVAQIIATTAELERTVAEVDRCRARRAFGNRQFDAENGRGPG